MCSSVSQLTLCRAEVEMVDKVLSQEIEEFEALVSSMPDHADQEDHHQQKTMSDYGSDEDEYDQLFMEVMSRPATVDRIDTLGDGAREQDQEMDISLG